MKRNERQPRNAHITSDAEPKLTITENDLPLVSDRDDRPLAKARVRKFDDGRVRQRPRVARLCRGLRLRTRDDGADE